ncbi:MAG: potassium-transporting ATPase subunit C [Chlamydiae bacterium RIFCSPHIGHO2_12_FULL_27_8]|nr:MAG: potassium-transporting ATPase subunit C [Chlamydiae bacterium RIFCSPHIGHO2_12_FULL_27_8]OGN66388.1 MAG: potassium-transporting ATPase subunit C [Chlamydiae bacterium RIFCSPLOWO2_01_FULL_28_7]
MKIKNLFQSILVLIIFTIILSFIYPFTIYITSLVFFKNKANGSLIYKDKKIVGSKFLGQKFSSEKYFHSRPSFYDYNGINSGASNYSQTSKKYKNSITQKSQNFRKINNLDNEISIPIDAVTYSGSGLDPHITHYNAIIQAKRVAQARNVNEEVLVGLIKKNLTKQKIFGRRCLNVLEMNLLLDEKYPVKK